MGGKYPALTVETLEIMISPVTEKTPSDLMLGITALLDYTAVPYSSNYTTRVRTVTVTGSTQFLIHKYCVSLSQEYQSTMDW